MKAFFYFLISMKSACSSSFFDVDDILKADLMPSALLMLDGPDIKHFSKPLNHKSSFKNESELLSSNGSWFDAYATMGFHRKMLNEYLCRNFIADEILHQMQQPLITHKLGRPFKSPIAEENMFFTTDRKSRAELADVKENLLSDPGSSSYRDWLSKTTTLEDIYRHYDKDAKQANPRDGEEGIEYDGGEITGYAMPGPTIDMHSFGHQYGGFVHPELISQEESEKHGGGYDYTPHHVHIHSNDDDDKGSNNGLALNDVFDIALTALAFLSFGMFILQVIMNITMNNTAATMMPMVDGTTGDAETFDGVRFKRDTASYSYTINELARRVLTSIETGFEADRDNGECLRRNLCENNKYSRSLKNGQKIWIPVWGLGMSWLSSRLISLHPKTTTMLDSLRACALGLANVDCASHYSGCDMRHLLRNRRSGRTRRSTSNGKKKGDD